MRHFIALLALISPAAAETPRVVADIAPVQSLVARVMQGVGSPEVLLPPGASPHGYSLKPSEAQTLSDADVVFWVGHGLTPWLEDPLETLASNAKRIELIQAKGIELHEPAMEGGDHGDDHDEHADEHDDEDKHEHADDHKDEHADDHKDEHADEHKEEHADDHDHAHDHGDNDPHIWLDPHNAEAMLTAIAATLSEHDPANAATYRENAEAAHEELEALEEELEAQLEPLHGKPFIVMHDAYGYFISHFDLTVAGALSESDASRPSPSKLRDIQNMIRGQNIRCLFGEPQLDTRLLKTALEGSEGQIGTLDPLGATLEPGPTLYPTLLRDMAASLSGCLNPS